MSSAVLTGRCAARGRWGWRGFWPGRAGPGVPRGHPVPIGVGRRVVWTLRIRGGLPCRGLPELAGGTCKSPAVRRLIECGPLILQWEVEMDRVAAAAAGALA